MECVDCGESVEGLPKALDGSPPSRCTICSLAAQLAASAERERGLREALENLLRQSKEHASGVIEEWWKCCGGGLAHDGECEYGKLLSPPTPKTGGG